MMSSESMTRKDLVTSYLSGWKQAGAGTSDSAKYVASTEQPVITQILYAAPGDQSTSSYTANVSKTTTMDFSYGFKMDAKAYVGFEVEAEFWTGETGGEAHVGVHTSMAMNNTNSYTSTVESFDGVETNATSGDVVVATVLKTKHFLFERPRMRYMFTKNPTDAQKIYFLSTVPEASTNAEQIISVREFLNQYKNNPMVLKNFVNVYAKDTATGLVKSDFITKGLVKKTTSAYVLQGNITKDVGKTVTTESGFTQTFDAEVGAYIDAKLVAGSVVVGGSLSFDVTVGVASSSTGTNSFSTAASFKDDDSWDQFNFVVYDDLRWGVPIYELQKDMSYTSGPNEPLSQPTTSVGMILKERLDTICVGDTVEATLTITNNSNPYITNTLIDSMQVEIEGTPNFNGVYQKIVIQPAQFMLKRGQSQDVKIRYRALDTTSLPISFYVNDGFLQNGNFNYLENSTISGIKTVGAACKTNAVRTPSMLSNGLEIMPFQGGLTMWNMSGSEVVTDVLGRTYFNAAVDQKTAMVSLKPGMYYVSTKTGTFKALIP